MIFISTLRLKKEHQKFAGRSELVYELDKQPTLLNRANLNCEKFHPLNCKKGDSMKNASAVSTLVSCATVSLAACGALPEHRETSSVYTANGMVTFTHPENDPFTVEKIIGANDLTPVLKNGANIPAKYGPLINAFGLISMGCTATHIGNGLVLTAGHCFSAPEVRGNLADCSKFTVQWGLRKDASAYLVSKCVSVLAYETNRDRDYAIFTVDNAPATFIPVNLKAEAKNGTSITIFGHPQARPLEWSKTCTVEDSSKGGWGADQFSHQCDTEPGNSGSTVLDDSTLTIIGIHDGGKVPWNYATHLLNTPIAEFASKLP